jgi:hypothetical protein
LDVAVWLADAEDLRLLSRVAGPSYEKRRPV